MRRFLIPAALCCWLLATDGHAATIIHAGRLIDGRSDEPQAEMSIVVEDGRITSVAAGYVEPQAGDKLIDLREYTVMPGLMDMHTHLMSQHSKDSYTERFFMDQADYALRSTVYARATLMAGFTTVRDLGDNGVNSIALRKAIDQGWVPGPRIFTSGKSLATTGGHADPTNALRGDYRRDPGPLEGVINGPDDARKAVRQRYKDGADLIKLTATGGVLSLAASGQNPQFTDEELRAVVATAKDYNMTVAVHAHGTEGIKRAVLAGVDSIEHGTFMTDEVIELMKQKGTYWVPTNMAGEWVAEKAKEPGYFPEIVRPKAAAIGPVIRETFRQGLRRRREDRLRHRLGRLAARRECPRVRADGRRRHAADEGHSIGHAHRGEAAANRRPPGDDRSKEARRRRRRQGQSARRHCAMRDVVFVMKEGVVFKSP